MREKVRKHFVFTGRVQGVGFRFIACQAAGAIGLMGWVRNCWDGSVEAQVQGTDQQIQLFLEQISQAHYIQVENLESKEIPLKEERRFRVLST